MRDVYRILDANFNRAREALRVAEDFARFILDDGPLAHQAKQLRSRLQLAYQQFPQTELLAARDTRGDVGTQFTSITETSRPAPAAVATAACKRLTEALRTLEEYAKLISPDQATSLEQMRYEAYGFEQRLSQRAAVIGRFDRVRLYVLLTHELCKRDWLETARLALAGGAECIQLREKTLSSGPLLDMARRLREVTAAAGAMLIINDRPDIAVLCGADGVHIGQDDLPAAQARRIVGPTSLVGVSTHTLEQARQAQKDGADYIGVGPMFATTTKDAGPLAGPQLLRHTAAEVSIPQVAIGGISQSNLPELAAAVSDAGSGLLRVAVCNAVIGADDPQAAATSIRAALA